MAVFNYKAIMQQTFFSEKIEKCIVLIRIVFNYWNDKYIYITEFMISNIHPFMFFCKNYVHSPKQEFF